MSSLALILGFSAEHTPPLPGLKVHPRVLELLVEEVEPLGQLRTGEAANAAALLGASPEDHEPLAEHRRHAGPMRLDNLTPMGASWLTPSVSEHHKLLLIEMGGRWHAQCSCGWQGTPSQTTREDVEAEFSLHVDLARLPQV